jgi:hypothetical protein
MSWAYLRLKHRTPGFPQLEFCVPQVGQRTVGFADDLASRVLWENCQPLNLA